MAVNNHKMPDVWKGTYASLVAYLNSFNEDLKKAALVFLTTNEKGEPVSQLAFIEANKTIHLIEGSQDIYTKEEINEMFGDLVDEETGEVTNISTYVTEATTVVLNDANSYTDDKIAVLVYDDEGDL